MTEPIIFLDIDGVLNCHEFDPDSLCGQIHRDKVIRLNRVLRLTGAKIVLSSAWRYMVHRKEVTLAGMDWFLRSHGVIAGRVIGATRPDTIERGVWDGIPGNWPVTNERGQQIREWIGSARGQPTSYVVIDDLDLGISAAGHPFVRTDGTKGLTEVDTQRALAFLTGLPSETF